MAPSRSVLRTPRHLLFRHGRRLLKQSKETGDADLPAGFEELHSFYIPGIQSGLHTIQVRQDITAGTGPTQQKQSLYSEKQFDVIRSRFTLADGDIHSSYPPQGHQDGAECLPHVLFNNPQLPWEILGSENAARAVPPPVDYNRARTPWLAVFVFTQDELQLSAADLDPTKGIFSKISGFEKGAVQTPTFSVNVPVSQICNIQSTVTPVKYDAKTDGDVKSDVILLPVNLFKSLFTQYDAGGNATKTIPYVYHLRYLSHKRDINTQGMAVTGAESLDDKGSFGVVFSGRSGPTDISIPTQVYAHLVSVEDVEQMTVPTATDIRFVALPSLYSWNYICMPPNALNVYDEFMALGNSISVLGPPLSSDEQASIRDKPQGPQILARIQAGYSLARYRVQTGEQTACLMRGPLIPTVVPTMPDWWPLTSMAGTDLQNFDQNFGLMDISYSSAWQLGRAMAIADQPFVIALSNIRKQIFDLGVTSAQNHAARDLAFYVSKRDLLSAIPEIVHHLASLSERSRLTEDSSVLDRWKRENVEPLDLTYHGEAIASYLIESIPQAALDVASAVDLTAEDPVKRTQPTNVPYDEYNAPFSADWVIVLRWILDRLFLDAIPSHYLLTDSSQLPTETLHFFNVDHNWIDALIDGALSLANHVDQTSDPTRDGIKVALNRYLHTKNSQLGYLPPIPQYGCYVRSAIVKKYPDLIVQVLPEPKVGDPPVLLRHEILDTGTMLCLFSEAPSEQTWTTLTFTQPSHQQSFIAADKITAASNDGKIPTTFNLDYRRAYTVSKPVDKNLNDPFVNPPWTMDASGKSSMYIWTQTDPVKQTMFDVRNLLVENLATSYLNSMNANIPKNGTTRQFDDTIASSALVGYALNNPCWRLEIDISSKVSLRALGLPRSMKLRAFPVPEKIRIKRPSRHVKHRETLPHSIKYLHPDQRQRNARPPPHPRAPPPHKARIPIRPALVMNKPTGPIPTFPQYGYFFSSTDAPGVPGTVTDISMGGAAQDIICSIRLNSDPYLYALQYITISIPFGPPTTNPSPQVPRTLTNSRVLGAAMLSNLRFNPLLSFSNDAKSLIVRLLPRSTAPVPVSKCTDLSFMLTSVLVNESTVQPYWVVPDITEQYNKQTPYKPKTSPKFSLVARPKERREG